MVAVFRLREKDHTTTATGAADLGSQRSLAERHGNELLDHRRADSGRVGFAQLPFFADQFSHQLPVRHGKRMMHGPRNLTDPLKVVEDFLVAVNVRLKYLPVVDPGLPRRSGIDQNKPPVQVLWGHAYSGMVNPIRVEVNRAYAAIERGIVILASSRHFDELRFH